MKALTAVLVALLLVLQYALWFGDGGVLDLWRLHRAAEARIEENARLEERNRALEGEVEDLKQGLAAVEERARAELGMIGKDERFYQIVE